MNYRAVEHLEKLWVNSVATIQLYWDAPTSSNSCIACSIPQYASGRSNRWPLHGPKLEDPGMVWNGGILIGYPDVSSTSFNRLPSLKLKVKPEKWDAPKLNFPFWGLACFQRALLLLAKRKESLKNQRMEAEIFIFCEKGNSYSPMGDISPTTHEGNQKQPLIHVS